MIKNFTSNDLVSFLYHETSAATSSSIQNELMTDGALRTAYEELAEARAILPKAQFRPSAKAIQNILKYSQNEMVVA
jgi:hypothetical protein